MEFTEDWHMARSLWDRLLPAHFPDGIQRAMEIGSFEGRSAVYLLDRGVKNLLCVDTWAGSDEAPYPGLDMAVVRERFLVNTAEAAAFAGATVRSWKMTSLQAMSRLLADGEGGSFDFVYVDGAHTAADALTDAVLAFRLCREGGWVYFDDYHWVNLLRPDDPLGTPRMGIDAFCDVFADRIQVVKSEYQVHVQVVRHEIPRHW